MFRSAGCPILSRPLRKGGYHNCWSRECLIFQAHRRGRRLLFVAERLGAELVELFEPASYVGWVCGFVVEAGDKPINEQTAILSGKGERFFQQFRNLRRHLGHFRTVLFGKSLGTRSRLRRHLCFEFTEIFRHAASIPHNESFAAGMCNLERDWRSRSKAADEGVRPTCVCLHGESPLLSTG